MADLKQICIDGQCMNIGGGTLETKTVAALKSFVPCDTAGDEVVVRATWPEPDGWRDGWRLVGITSIGLTNSGSGGSDVPLCISWWTIGTGDIRVSVSTLKDVASPAEQILYVNLQYARIV